MSAAELSRQDYRVLAALAEEGPWGFSNGVVWPQVLESFGDPYPSLERLEWHGLVRSEFFCTGAVAEFQITAQGRVALRAGAVDP